MEFASSALAGQERLLPFFNMDGAIPGLPFKQATEL